MVELKFITYEESRLDYFKQCLKKAQKRVNRLHKAGAALAPYGSAQWIKYNEAVDVRNYYADAVKVFEFVDDFCQKRSSCV